jgi:hypothetical protein
VTTIARDRRAALEAHPDLNGIDFVEIRDDSETRLRVHFLNDRPDGAVLAGVSIEPIISGGDAIPDVTVFPLAGDAWGTDLAGRRTLDLQVAAPGDFSTYTLRIVTEPVILDRYFDHVEFSFKARCPSTVDCEAMPSADAPPADARPPIDYLAKDFDSFRKALSDFSAQRYPAWQERSRADFGVMFMEALSSLADDLSYQQDRIAAEGWIETATQRRSLVRLARLVDYEPRVATAARVWLQLEVDGGWAGVIPTGVAASAQDAEGAAVEFETGTGLDEPFDGDLFAAAGVWNHLAPHWWDDSEAILPRGATAMWVEAPALVPPVGKRLLIETTRGIERPLRQLVRLVATEEAYDPLFQRRVLRLVWSEVDALEHARALQDTTVHGNLVPATQGRTYTERFVTAPRAFAAPGDPLPTTPRALVRTGANRSRQYLHTLRQEPLAWLAAGAADEQPRPELRLTEISASEPRRWRWRRSLLDGAPPREVFTVDPVRYRVLDGVPGAADYDGEGDTLRFGDGVFGAIPADGAVFEVTYRAGGGARGNVAPGAVDRIDPAHPFAAVIASVTNPLAADGGRDAESADDIREMAPQAFRARPLRAVRAEDYEQTAAGLPWVQRAGTTFRHTGSWLSVFTAVDPRGGLSLPDERRRELVRLLDRRRLAGYESFVLAPRYASFDLAVTVCARPDAFRGDVERGVLTALDTRGYFHPDNFTFGVPLERSTLAAAIQDVPGVDGVVELRYRRRGHSAGFLAMPDAVSIARDEIVRVDNDPNHPDRGSLRVTVMGGK